MAPVVLPRYAVQFMDPGLPNPARCASLAGKGLLRIDATHWLSVVVPSLCTPAAVAGGDRVIPHREVSYILLAAGFSALDPELADRDVGWALTPARMTAFFGAADATGDLHWGQADSVEHACALLRHASAKMNTADRLLRTDDVLFHPAVPLPTAVASFSFITAAALGRGADNPFGALAQFKLLLGDGANTPDERLAPNDIFQDVLVSIVNTASASLGHAPMTIPRAQAADVVAFLLRSRPQLPEHVQYFPAHEQFAEITRRGMKSLAIQLEPHFDAVWATKFPTLQWAFPKPTSGSKIRSMLSSLCITADYTMADGLSLELISTLCADIELIKTDPGKMDTPALRGAGNDDRCNALGIHLQYQKANRLAVSSSASQQSETDITAIIKLGANIHCAALRAELEICTGDVYMTTELMLTST